MKRFHTRFIFIKMEVKILRMSEEAVGNDVDSLLEVKIGGS